MSLAGIVFFGTCMIIIGRIMIKSWFNHLTLYSFIWTVVLSFYCLKLIRFHSIIAEGWLFIISSWIALFLGSSLIYLARITRTEISSVVAHMSDSGHHQREENYTVYERRLKKAVIILLLLTSIGIIFQWLSLIKEFGSFGAALASGFIRYQLRVAGETTQGVPYLSSLGLAACCLAGIYTGLRRRIDYLSILSLLIVVAHSITIMGRATILIALTLLVSSYLITLRSLVRRKRIVVRRKWFVPLLVIVLLAVFGSEQIRATRGVIESFKKYGETESLSILRAIPFLTPSIYTYLSGPPVVLSEYLRKGGEDVPPGWYTFAPIYRLFAKANFVKAPSYYQPFYLIPVPMNTGSYLREVHADFGEAGVLLFPFLLGILCMVFTINHTFGLSRAVILSYLYVIVVMSFVCNAVGLGYVSITFLVAVGIALCIERKKPIRHSEAIESER